MTNFGELFDLGLKDMVPMAVTEALTGEAVDDGETGFLVPPGDVDALADKIRLLLSDAELRARMSQTAQQRMMEKFDVNAIMRQLYALYDRLLTERT